MPATNVASCPLAWQVTILYLGLSLARKVIGDEVVVHEMCLSKRMCYVVNECEERGSEEEREWQ